MWPLISSILSLRQRFRLLALYRGLWIYILIFGVELIIAAMSFYALPTGFAIVPHVVLPLILVQWYALWTHAVLTRPSQRPWRERIPPFKSTLRTSGPALAIFLAAKALQKNAFVHVWSAKAMKFEGRQLALLALATLCVEIVLVAPARLLLMRIHASMLQNKEATVVPIDGALRQFHLEHGENGLLAIQDAWSSLDRRACVQYVITYTQALLAVVFGGGMLLFFWFSFYISIAMLGWRF
jgi:hypothetical protein